MCNRGISSSRILLKIVYTFSGSNSSTTSLRLFSRSGLIEQLCSNCYTSSSISLSLVTPNLSWSTLRASFGFFLTFPLNAPQCMQDRIFLHSSMVAFSSLRLILGSPFCLTFFIMRSYISYGNSTLAHSLQTTCKIATVCLK